MPHCTALPQVGVGAQCLLRQLDALLPHASPAEGDITQVKLTAGTSNEADRFLTTLYRDGDAGSQGASVSATPGTASKQGFVPKLSLAANALVAVTRISNQTSQRASNGKSPIVTGGRESRPDTTSQQSAAAAALAGRPGAGALTQSQHDELRCVPPCLPQPASAQSCRASSAGTQPGTAACEAIGGRHLPASPRPDSESAADWSRGKDAGLLVITLGCKVDADGGDQPTPRVRVEAGASSATSGVAAQHNLPPRSGLQSALRTAAGLKDDSLERSATGTKPAATGTGTPVQRFILQMCTQQPDRCVAQLLVEHELNARRHRCQSWHHVQMGGTLYRRRGCDVVPFDVLYAGWTHQDALPCEGTLVLDVSCLPQRASPWLSNPRLHLNS